LEDWMERLMKLNSPTAIRYPRGSDNAAISDYASTGNSFDLIVNRPNSNALFITYGREFAQVLGANQVTDIEYNADILKL
ncbi:MAG: hypothetical protein RR829_03930, partial [Oscillospiraceae bacterium]